MDGLTIIGAAAAVAGIFAGAAVKIMGGRQKSTCRECFRELREAVSDHDTRITRAETEIKGIFKALDEIKADIREILALLRGRP